MQTQAGIATPPKRKGLSKTARDSLVAYTFILPNFLGFAIFTLVPLVFGLVLSFMEWNGSSDMSFVGLSNFTKLFSDKTFITALKNTLIYTVGTVPITIIFALGLAILLNQKVKGRNFFRTISFFPYVASLVAVAAVWNFLFSPTRGPVNAILSSITGIAIENLPKWAADKVWAMPTVIGFSVWKNMGYYMVIYLAGLQGISPELYEAASLDGATGWQKFTNVTLPQLQPTTFFVTMIMIISSFKVYDIFINIFAGADNQLTDISRVVVYQIYNTAFRNLNYGYASAMAMVLFVIVLVITLVQFYGEKKMSE